MFWGCLVIEAESCTQSRISLPSKLNFSLNVGHKVKRNVQGDQDQPPNTFTVKIQHRHTVKLTSFGLVFGAMMIVKMISAEKQTDTPADILQHLTH